MTSFKRIGITVKSGLDNKDETVSSILSILEKTGLEVLFDAKRANDIACAATCAPLVDFKDIDVLLVIGGDGTILRAIRELKDFRIPILSVNRGTVGFMAEITLKEADTLIPDLLHGKGVLEERRVLEVKAFRNGNVFHTGCVLNEAVIAQGAIARLLDLKTSVNGEPLATFHADGLIVATPTGSTAYSLAAGGPIVHPRLTSTILTPLNPHSFNQKPIVIPADHVVEMEVLTKENKYMDTEVSLTLDGQVYISLQRGDQVVVQGCEKTVTFLRRKEDTFFSTLRQKLKWAERLEDKE